MVVIDPDVFSLTFEFPINGGSIWVEIRDGHIMSAPVALCLDCGREYDISYCECTLDACMNCQYTVPEMVARRERIEKIYVKLHPLLEDIAISAQKRIGEALNG